MTAKISNRQLTFLVMISVFALKLQGLFALISNGVGRDGWIFLSIYFVIDIFMLFLVIGIIKMFPGMSFYELLCKCVGKVVAKIIIAFYAIFFLLKIIIPYKGVNDLFDNVLFDELPWSIFSILFLIALYFVASKGLNSIARMSEILFWIIIVGVVGGLTMSLGATNLIRLFPMLENGFNGFLETGRKYNLWFGDFIILFMFMGRTDEKTKFRWIVLGYVISAVIVVVLFVEFYSIYENIAIYENQGLVDVTQFALIGLDIGRIDRILVLCGFFSTFITPALFVFIVSDCISSIFSTGFNRYFILFTLVVIYVLDTFCFADISFAISLYANIFSYFSVFVYEILTLIIFMFACAKKLKQKELRKLGVKCA